VAADPILLYRQLQKGFSRDIKGDVNRELFRDIYAACRDQLKGAERIDLKSLVPGKKYFAFQGKFVSRAVNKALYADDVAEWETFSKAVIAKDPGYGGLTASQITRVVYSAAMAFCCYVDTIKEGDKKTPGTFFEYLIGHLFAWRLGTNPGTSLQVLNLDLDTNLPTDYTFQPGGDRTKFHLPIKTSTRERIIQVWAHQRVLDGVYGTGRFVGTPVILTETKTDKKKREVIEICLPDQWRLYQLHIAQMKRVYYLDLPAPYAKLNAANPPLVVKEFGEFLFEADAL
jgi:hypothetical protein